MAKLSNMYPTTAPPRGPMATVAPARTHEGGAGYTKSLETELFTLAVTNMVGEDTFYETGKARDTRFVGLVTQAAQGNPDWTARFIGWLRSDANMRTASLIAAAEYAGAGAPNGRRVVDSACQRADEPGEMLAYWRGTHGRKLPFALKRGLADAAVRLYNERSFVKWDSDSAAYRMGDVIDVVHPSPRDDRQSALFRYALDVRHGREAPRGLDGLGGIAEYLAWRKAPTLDMPRLVTWENLSSTRKMDAAAWGAVIPQMGYMALLRNLRNFEAAGVSAEVLAQVAAKLADPAEVAESRQLPFRFWSAWKHSGTLTFGPAIQAGLDHSVANIPAFHGRTLVMVDTSGSMNAPMSAKSKINRVEAAALFGACVIKRSSADSRLVMYATDAADVTPARGTAVLRTTEMIVGKVGAVGHGTNTWPSVAAAIDRFGDFDRIMVFTDMQDHPSGQSFPANTAVYVWDLAGYKTANIELGSGRYLLGGLSDATFKLVPILERGVDAGWDDIFGPAD